MADPDSCGDDADAAQSTGRSVNVDSIYEFYTQQLYPALASSLPLLVQRIALDSKHWIGAVVHGFVQFFLPKSVQEASASESMTFSQLQNYPNPAEFMLRHFDTSGDGYLSMAELLNMTNFLQSFPSPHPRVSWGTWFSKEWPLMDWKVGIFLWRTSGGILFLLAVCSIVPGRFHGWSARILRWPVLGLTYFLIAVELSVYVVIRLFIRVAEYIVARPRHRELRRKMAQSQSYEEWYHHAEQLDRSQKRDLWIRQEVDDETSSQYNWAVVRELMGDLKKSRERGDSVMALAVLQQCTRKNLGGVMSEDLFSYSNTGEPKYIVSEFVNEVAITIRWVTKEAMKIPADSTRGAARDHGDMFAEEKYGGLLQIKVRKEREKIRRNSLSSLIGVTVDFLDDDKKEHDNDDILKNSSTPPRNSNQSDCILESSDEGTRGSVTPLAAFQRQEVLTFLKRVRGNYGRPALCLSGGAMMGNYHFGHIMGLLEAGMLPQIISGASAGAVIGSIICCRTDDEVRRDLQPSVLGDKLTCFSRPLMEQIKSVWKTGSLYDFDDWMELMQWFTCGNTTFEEAYKRSGRVFCITLSSTSRKAPPVLLNYLTAPNVIVASAVIASAAVPGFVPPVRLLYKDADGSIRQEGETFFDGSIKQDIPVKALAEMFNCQFFIVCQCNPHVVPFFFGNKGSVGRPSRWSSGLQETSWRGGFLLTALEMYLKNHMKAKFQFLHELEAAPGFTSTMMTQEFGGTSTIIPQVSIWDYFRLVRDPRPHELPNYFQVGSVAAYEHLAMIRLHYSIADVLDECVLQLESGNSSISTKRRSTGSSSAQSAKNRRSHIAEMVSPIAIRTVLRPDVDDQADASGSLPKYDDYSLDDENSSEWIDLDQ